MLAEEGSPVFMADPGRLRMLRAEHALAPATRLGCQPPDKRGSTICQHSNHAAIRSAGALGGLTSASVALSSGSRSHQRWRLL